MVLVQAFRHSPPRARQKSNNPLAPIPDDYRVDLSATKSKLKASKTDTFYDYVRNDNQARYREENKLLQDADFKLGLWLTQHKNKKPGRFRNPNIRRCSE